MRIFLFPENNPAVLLYKVYDAYDYTIYGLLVSYLRLAGRAPLGDEYNFSRSTPHKVQSHKVLPTFSASDVTETHEKIFSS
jgi:hypothetical protein